MGLKMIDFPYIFHVNVWKRQCQLMGFQAVLIYLVLNFLLLKNHILRGLGDYENFLSDAD